MVPGEVSRSERDFKTIERAAEDGNMVWQRTLGFIYVSGAKLTKAVKFVPSKNIGLSPVTNEFGEMYQWSRNIGKNPALAAKWLGASAAQGDEASLIYLGKMYQQGEGVQKDTTKAAGLFKTAATQGDPLAALFLARLYRDGKGVKQDCKQASLWFRQSALRLENYGSVGLFMLYAGGCKDFPADYRKAYFWFRLLQSRYWKKSGSVMQKADDPFIAGRYSDKEIHKAQKIVEEHLAVTQRNHIESVASSMKPMHLQYSRHRPLVASAYYRDGYCTKAGYAIPDTVRLDKNIRKALPCRDIRTEPEPSYNEALDEVRKGNVQAQVFLGWLYYLGKGCHEDKEKAFALIKKAAEEGSPEGQLSLSLFYGDVKNPHHDNVQAYFWRKLSEKAYIGGTADEDAAKLSTKQKSEVGKELRAWQPKIDLKKAETGNLELQYWVGMLFNNGWGYAQDSLTAAKWFKKSALKGNPYAQYMLSAAYSRGDGIEKSFQDAFFWDMVRLKGNREKVVDIENELEGSRYLNHVEIVKLRQKAFSWRPE